MTRKKFTYTAVHCVALDTNKSDVTGESFVLKEMDLELNEQGKTVVYNDLEVIEAMEIAGWQYIDTIITRHEYNPKSSYLDRHHWEMRFKRPNS